MPVNEFSSAVSWGYDPSYYFAIDSFYGGALAMAKFVNAAHVTGRGVTLDVVYNHSLEFVADGNRRRRISQRRL